MNKIYFAPNWGMTSDQMVSDYIKQTRGNTGRWGDIVVVTDPVEAEYLIIQDRCDTSLFSYFEEDKRLYFSREAMDSTSIHSYPNTKKYSYWDDTGFLWTKWWYPNKSSGGINKTYDELLAEELPPYDKDNALSCVQSDKRMTEGHVLRYNFLANFINTRPDIIDLYGSINFSNKELKDNDKFYALSNYKYCLAFDNQDTIKNFFGTQFTDSILYWTLPIYWGGADLSRFFPQGSFIQIDIRNPNELDRVIDIVQNDDYESRIPAIKEARELILNKYNMWPMISEIIQTERLSF